MIKVLFRRASLGGICLGIACCPVILQDAYAGERQYHPVSLNQGTLLQQEWAVGVIRDGGKQGGQRPCLMISSADTRGPSGEEDFSGYSKVCSALPPDGPPSILSVVAGEGSREVTVLGMAFVPQVASAYLDFGPYGHTRVKLKELNSVQMRTAGVRSIRYAALVFNGDRCLRQVKGYSPKGNEIYRGHIDRCRESRR